MKKKDEILEIIKQRNITQLIHFTNKKNINSIIKNGLLNNDELKRRNLNYISNDPERRDKWTYTISLSITNKNSDLYDAFKYRQKLSDNDFTIIKINPVVITENECFFCDTNAASHTFNHYRDNEDEIGILKSSLMFKKMFKKVVIKHIYNFSGKIIRSKQKPNETTCPGAEICLIGNIPPEKFINLEELKLL
tara:strand:- start:60 stop:638 length:579 start_codon:yes stop_codon:yes gene_type:complete